MNENKLKEDYQNIYKNTINKVANIIKEGDIKDPKNKDLIKEYLNNTDYEYCNCIGEFIASLFGIDRADMIVKDKSIEVVHARGLWWYALYFMMHKSDREISIMMELSDATWKETSICLCRNRIKDELKLDIDLRYKWDMIKKMIYIDKHPNAYDEPFSAPIGYKIKIFKPKGIDVQIVEEDN